MKFNPISSSVMALANELSRMFNKGIGADNLANNSVDSVHLKDGVLLKLERPGQIGYFARSTPPDGWLEANGALLSRIEYPDLWTEAQASGNLVSEATWAAGNYGSYSTGDGTTTFRIPELRAEFIRGWDNGRGIDSGRTLGSWQADAFRSHNHSCYRLPHFTSERIGGTQRYRPGDGTDNAFILDNSIVQYAGGPETRPCNVALLVCIFAGRRVA